MGLLVLHVLLQVLFAIALLLNLFLLRVVGASVVVGGAARCPGTSAAAAPGGFATFAADLGHVLTVLAHSFAALAACGTSFFGAELMGHTLLMSSPSSLAGNFLLTL